LLRLETDRLVITGFTPEMARAVHENSLDEDNRRFVPDEVFETEAEALETIGFLMSRYESEEGPLVYPVLLKDGTVIGHVQAALIGEGTWEIGYHIGSRYTGRGYATEAVAAFLPAVMGRLGIRQISGICVQENAASRKVMEKSGFHLEYEGIGDYQGERRPVCRYIFSSTKGEDGKDTPIRMGSIPGLDQPVSRIFFGTASPPVSTDEGAAPDLLDSVLASGINTFDSARSYGRAENALGKWMESRKNRDRVTVLSKCGDVRNGKVLVNRQVITEQLSQSLDALRTDHIDIYLMHRHDPNTPAEEIIDTLNEFRETGKITVFGVSNWTHRQIEEANRYAASHGLQGFSVSSPNYGLTRQMADPYGGDCVTISGPENREAREWYTASRMPVVAYSSLGRGFFSGRFRAGDYETARRVLDIYAQKGYLYEENMRRLKRAEKLAEEKHLSVSEIAMRYVFSSPMNLFAVVSTASPERMRMNIRAAAHPLSSEEVRYLEED